MKKLSIILVLALLTSLMATLPGYTEGEFHQSPYLDALVESGELPPVEERLPEHPTVADEYLAEYAQNIGVGKYGGNLRTTTTSTGMVGDLLVAITENLLVMQSVNSGNILPNLVDDYQVNEDGTIHTFTLKKGLKWSDGTLVTMEDFRFGIEDVEFNPAINSIVPAWLTVNGQPAKFAVKDDVTFTLTFQAPYGGFATHLSCNGWKDYSYFCLPSAWLKPFHKGYAEECHGSEDAYYAFIKPFAEVLGVENYLEGDNWGLVFNGVKLDIWSATDPTKAMQTIRFAGLLESNSPVLYPWIMKSSENGVTIWERNPYYFKVDADGNQLPYIDTITVTYVESAEMVQMNAVSGECDFLREAATLTNISLYRENAASANIQSPVLALTKNPADVMINMTYGLNADGTVKDDASKAWQEAMSTNHVRRAMMLSIDAQEVAEAVYQGFAECSPYSPCNGDIDAANALLDEIGMIDINGDGWRETPSGLAFAPQVWLVGTQDIAWLDISQLYQASWHAIGLNISINNVESSLYATSVDANEVPLSMAWPNNRALWYYNNWQTGNWAGLYNTWYKAGGLYSELGDGYLAPDGDILEFFQLMDTVTTVTPEEAVSVNNERMMEIVASECYIIEPLVNICQPVVLNAGIKNIPTGGPANSVNYSLEICYFDAE